MILALATTLVVAGSAQAAEFVANGNFIKLSRGPGGLTGSAKTTATGWTTSGYNFVFQNGNTTESGVSMWTASNHGSNTWDGTAPSGNFVAMDGDYKTGAMTQTITGLTVGKVYSFTFNYAYAQQEGFTGDTIQHLIVGFGNSSFTTPNYDLASKSFSGWSTYTGTLTANATSEVLSFLAYGNTPVPPFALFSNVSITGSVPEPATWAMMLVGLGVIGAAARRRHNITIAYA